MAEVDAIVFVPSDEMRMPPITSANTTKTAGTVVITTIPTKQQQDDNHGICHSPGGVRIITTPRNSGNNHTSSNEEREGCDNTTDDRSSHDVSIECCSIDSTDQQESYTSTIELDPCLTPKRGLLFRKKKKHPPNETPATPATDSESVSSSSENQQLNGEEPTNSIDASDSNSLSPLGDIVAYQEWHPARRQPLSFRYNPSSVCGLSVETIATKVGRSPVVVSFDKSSPINIEGPAFPMADDLPLHRVPTGRFPTHSGSNLDDGVVDEAYSKSPNTEQGCSDYGLSVIESTLASMMCNGKGRSNSCSSSD